MLIYGNMSKDPRQLKFGFGTIIFGFRGFSPQLNQHSFYGREVLIFARGHLLMPVIPGPGCKMFSSQNKLQHLIMLSFEKYNRYHNPLSDMKSCQKNKIQLHICSTEIHMIKTFS